MFGLRFHFQEVSCQVIIGTLKQVHIDYDEGNEFGASISTSSGQQK
jgi:hypothetical protein